MPVTPFRGLLSQLLLTIQTQDPQAALGVAFTLTAVRQKHLPTGQREAALFGGEVPAERTAVWATVRAQGDGTYQGAVGLPLASQHLAPREQ